MNHNNSILCTFPYQIKHEQRKRLIAVGFKWNKGIGWIAERTKESQKVCVEEENSHLRM